MLCILSDKRELNGRELNLWEKNFHVNESFMVIKFMFCFGLYCVAIGNSHLSLI